MAEKMTEVLEQYGISASSITRGRGAFFCRGQEGYYKLEPFAQSVGRLEKEHAVKECLYEAGFQNIDRYVLVKDWEELCQTEEESASAERFLAADRYHNTYVLKCYFDGKECDLKNQDEVKLAIGNLRTMHRIATEIPAFQKTDIVSKTIENYGRHNRELKRVRTYISGVNPKQEFELKYISMFSYFYNRAVDLENLLKETLVCHNPKRMGFCHGAYHQHNVLMLSESAGGTVPEHRVATLCFDKFHFDNQLLDLYYFMRKLLEKNHFDYEIFHRGIQEYEADGALTEADYMFLYILFAYPEKFWKLSNRYMNSKKTWVPPKFMEKLDGMMELEKEKNAFLLEFQKEYGIHIS